MTTNSIASGRDTLARTIWGEARGQGTHAMEAVACVVMNRAKNPRWWGTTVEEVCRANLQFSCWNKDDPNLPKLLDVTGTDPQFTQARAIAANAMLGGLEDFTRNSDSYYDTSIPPPSWAKDKTPNIYLGNMRFYSVELPPTKQPQEDPKTVDPLTIVTIVDGIIAGVQEAVAVWPAIKALLTGEAQPSTTVQAQIDAAFEAARAAVTAA